MTTEQTNQSIECTCRVEGSGHYSTGKDPIEAKRIIHGPCHSPGPEVWEALRARSQEYHDEAALVESKENRLPRVHLGTYWESCTEEPL